MLPNTCIITVRDFLTDKHGFTLPASRLSSYDYTLKHTSSSLFRHPKAFTIHFHASVHENNCETPLEKEKWEAGEYFKEGRVTLWAHFVRVSGVDIFGMSLEERELQYRSGTRRRRKELRELRMKKVSGVGKSSERKENAMSMEGYSLPPPHIGHHTYFSRYTAIAPLEEEKAPGDSTCSDAAQPFTGFQPTMVEDSCGDARTAEGSSLRWCAERRGSESPLFEPEVMIKREISPLNWEDDTVIEWDDEVCC